MRPVSIVIRLILPAISGRPIIGLLMIAESLCNITSNTVMISGVFMRDMVANEGYQKTPFSAQWIWPTPCSLEPDVHRNIFFCFASPVAE